MPGETKMVKKPGLTLVAKSVVPANMQVKMEDHHENRAHNGNNEKFEIGPEMNIGDRGQGVNTRLNLDHHSNTSREREHSTNINSGGKLVKKIGHKAHSTNSNKENVVMNRRRRGLELLDFNSMIFSKSIIAK